MTELLRKTTSLTEDEMISAMTQIMEGQIADEDIETFLVNLAERGETVDEITGAARVLRAKAAAIQAPENAVDCCGTGGDHAGTYNISTAVALVSAACGVPMAKHGNRAASSKSGAADVLEALGVNLNISPAQCEEALRRFNFTFLMAPHHHGAMKHVAPVRKKLGRRTIFNLLGPLANPASTKLQLVGVYDEKWLRPMAEVLKRLGTQRAWVVHGSDGLDEITTTGTTKVVILKNDGTITEETLCPTDFNLPTSKAKELQGGDAQGNAEALRSLLNGEQSAYRDIVLANSAAVLCIFGSNFDIGNNIKKAAKAIDNKEALHVLNNYAAFTKEGQT